MPRSRLLLGGVLIVLIGAVAVWYSMFRPTRVAERAMNNVASVTTAKFEALLELTNNKSTQELLGEEGTVELMASGHFDRDRAARPMLAALVNLAIKTESLTMQIEGDTRFIDDKFYAKITKSPTAFPALVQLKDIWLQFERGGGATAQTPQSTPGPLFSSVEKVGKETIHGIDTVKYSAIATEVAVIKMMDGLADLLGTSLTGDQITMIKESVAQVKEVPVELWVRGFQSELKQVRVTLRVPDGNTVYFTLFLDEINQPVTITAPEGAVPLEQALTNR